MDAFDGAGQRHSRGGLAPDRVARGDAENGADAFAARKNGIAHGLVDRGRRSGVGRQEFVERCVDAPALAVKVFFQAKDWKRFQSKPLVGTVSYGAEWFFQAKV